MPSGEMEVKILEGIAISLHANTIGRDLRNIDTSLKSASFARVNDGANRRVGFKLKPSDSKLISHRIVHGIELLWSVVYKPTNRTVSLQLQCGERAEC
jgi:hypothetical protein